MLKKPVVIEEFGLTWFKKTPAQQRVLFKVRLSNQGLVSRRVKLGLSTAHAHSSQSCSCACDARVRSCVQQPQGQTQQMQALRCAAVHGMYSCNSQRLHLLPGYQYAHKSVVL